MVRFDHTVFLLAGIFLLPGCGDRNLNGNAQKFELQPALPNIIFILADDLGYGDLSCYGQEKFSTPNIDQLASEGIRFLQYYSGSTVCAPSRSALLTGQHTGHTFIRGNMEVQPEGQYPLPDSIFTLAEMLKSAGYMTGAFGKWGLGYPGSEGDPNKQGFDTFFGYNCQRLGHNYYPYHLWSNDQKLMLEENLGNQTGIYAPDLIHKRSLEFIESHKDNPFFLYVPSIIPHAELLAPDSIMQKHIGKYPPEKSYEGVDSGERYRQGPYGSQEYTHAAFAAMIDILDEQVGDIIRKVNELGIGNNTMIIFASDNGPHQEGGADPEYFDSNGPLRGFKRDLYEGGIRVPMIVKWPGVVQPGRTTDHVSAFWDVFPTIAEITQKDTPAELDGLSFLSTLKDNPENQEQHEYLYWEFHERGGRQAIRKGDWKAVKYDVFQEPDKKPELYNLMEDVGEQNNLAGEYPEIVSMMDSIFEIARVPSEVFPFNE